MTTRRAGFPFSLFVLLITLSSGCGAFDVNAHVASDTSWSGSFDGRTVDGNGNQTVQMGSANDRSGPSKCAVVQKQTRTGFLTVKIDGGEEKTTTAEFGVVSVCN